MDQKISALTEVTAPDGTEMLPIVSGGVTEKISTLNIASKLGNSKISKTVISSSQILAGNTSPVFLIPGVANNIIVLDSIQVRMLYVSAAYATNTTFRIGASTLNSADITDMLAYAGDRTEFVPLSAIGGAGAAAFGAGIGITFVVLTGNPTAGNGSLVIHLLYHLIDIT